MPRVRRQICKANLLAAPRASPWHGNSLKAKMETDQSITDFALEAGILVTGDLGRRELKWLVEFSSRETVAHAVNQLPGQQRPYPLNIARYLKIQFPQFAADDEAQARVAHVISAHREQRRAEAERRNEAETRQRLLALERFRRRHLG